MTERTRTARLRQDTRRMDDRASDEMLTPFQCVVGVLLGLLLFFTLPWALSLFV